MSLELFSFQKNNLCSGQHVFIQLLLRRTLHLHQFYSSANKKTEVLTQI